ncbi:MAG TPA: succinate dehydrogenase cytochrome b subunit [Desulfobacteraceae bacterium]|nr:succinate dehydrogenase cytochrome b subunit [Desulfobacteraceae bacterium]
MSWFTRTVTASLGKKYIMALSGLVLGAFLLVHAAGNTTILLGRSAFLSYAGHLHAFDFALVGIEFLLLAFFLAHVVTGLVLFMQNMWARPERYAVNNNAGGRTWGSATMPYTGIIVFLFILVHLYNFHFIAPGAVIADVVAEVLGSPLYTVLYGIGLTALALHISHGFWSLFQSAGINHPKYNRFIIVCAWVIGGLIIAVFGIIVVMLLVNSNLLA